MKEQLLSSPTIYRSDYLLYIDTSLQNIGDTTLKDHSGHYVFNSVYPDYTQAFRIVQDPVYGKCFQFDGSNGFYTQQPINLSQINFTLTIEFISTTNSHGFLFQTGNYTSSAVPGYNLGVNQFPNTYFQVFMMGVNSIYNRVLVPGTNPYLSVNKPNSLESFTVYKQNDTIRAVNNKTGDNDLKTLSVPSDSILGIGFDSLNIYTVNYPFVGLLKSIIIQ